MTDTTHLDAVSDDVIRLCVLAMVDTFTRPVPDDCPTYQEAVVRSVLATFLASREAPRASESKSSNVAAVSMDDPETRDNEPATPDIDHRAIASETSDAPTLKALREYSEAATPGKAWFDGRTANLHFRDPPASLYVPDSVLVAKCATGDRYLHNARFLAECVNFVRYALIGSAHFEATENSTASDLAVEQALLEAENIAFTKWWTETRREKPYDIFAKQAAYVSWQQRGFVERAERASTEARLERSARALHLAEHYFRSPNSYSQEEVSFVATAVISRGASLDVAEPQTMEAAS